MPRATTRAWTYDDTTQSGIYTAKLGFAAHAQELRRECRYAPRATWPHCDEEDCKAKSGPDIPFLYQTSWQGR